MGEREGEPATDGHVGGPVRVQRPHIRGGQRDHPCRPLPLQAERGRQILDPRKPRHDREAIRVWLLKILLGKAFRGSTTDQILTQIRATIQTAFKEHPSAAFPADAINQMLRSSRRFVFTEENIEALVGEGSYGSPDAFGVLALLYPHLRYEYSQVVTAGPVGSQAPPVLFEDA